MLRQKYLDDYKIKTFIVKPEQMDQLIHMIEKLYDIIIYDIELMISIFKNGYKNIHQREAEELERYESKSNNTITLCEILGLKSKKCD
jgi:uncharacterized membrane protein YbjE (DUF340 family)